MSIPKKPLMGGPTKQGRYRTEEEKVGTSAGAKAYAEITSRKPKKIERPKDLATRIKESRKSYS